MRRCLLAAAALLAAACSSSTTQLGAPIRQPVAVAFFDGVTTKLPGQVHRYMAVAAFAANELRLVDPADDKPVIGPGVVFPLSVPTAPGPTFLVAAAPGDTDGAGGPLPGLLAVAGRQAPGAAISPLVPALGIEIVATWNELTTTAPGLLVDLAQELSPVDPGIAGAELLSLAAMPVPGQPGRACLIAGLSGGRLAVVTFERDPASPVHALRRVPGLSARLVAARTATAAVPAGIPFDPLDLALEPDPAAGPPATVGRRIFAATGGALGDRNGAEVRGVAEITATFAADGSPGTWAMRGLDARAPTRLVAAQWVSEREPTFQRAEALDGVLRLQVFAVLDEGSCGPRHAIGCGVATLVPDDAGRNGGIAADPTGELPYRVPIAIPGHPLAIAAAAPRAGGDAPLNGANGFNSSTGFRVMTIAPGSGRRDASALVAVATASGALTFLDVARFGAGNDASSLRGSTRAGVVPSGQGGSTAVLAPPAPADGTSNTTENQPILVLWNDLQYAGTGPRAKTVNAASLTIPVPAAGVEDNIMSTPGYAQDDNWFVSWQGALPELSQRRGVVGRDPDGTAWVAIQSRGFDLAAGPAWVASVAMGAPELGVHSRDGGPTTTGDTVVIAVIDPAVCPSHVDTSTGTAVTVLGQLRATVLDFLPPSPDHPLGALKIDRVADPAPGAACASPIVPVPAAGTVATTEAFLTVRASGLLVAGATFGYAGRPVVSGTIVDSSPTPVDNPPDTATIVAQTFRLAWEPEEPLEAVAGDPLQPAAARRDAAERLAMARKARRSYYPSEQSCGSGLDASDPVCAAWKAGWNPMTPAPDERVVLRFRLAAYCRPNKLGVPCTDGAGAVLPMKENTGLLFTTQRGLREWSRRPPTGGAFPRAVGWMDKSAYAADRRTEFVGCFTDDQVVRFDPSTSAPVSAVVR